eukprot:TRINITY_DN2275_c0_g1_i1.p1 TRINITY_DN2275_c0_g1~~TRINITY_DN2275_c0_g1_i1.p1  ORF type:complete len:1693 (+),score=426.63 TRINITY_DN2275_c0_g1_i1:69-5147(+)
MMGRKRVLVGLCLLAVAQGGVIGNVTGPYSSGLIKLSEDKTTEAVNYRRTNITVKGASACSGLVTRFALGRVVDAARNTVHEIAMWHHTKGESMCMHVGTLTGLYAEQSYVGAPDFLECTTPPADLHTQDTEWVIEWGRERTRFFVNGGLVGAFQKSVGDPSTDGYFKHHDTFIGMHHSNNATMDGLSTPTCEVQSMLITDFVVTPYDETDFSSSAAYNVSVKSSSTVAKFEDWADHTNWVRQGQFYAQTSEEFLLQGNVKVGTSGIEITAALVNPLGQNKAALFSGSNGNFQDTKDENTLTNPAPWKLAADATPLVSWRYDPFDEEARGALIFDILSTGEKADSIKFSQVFDETLPTSGAQEFCLYIKLSATMNRTLEVSMFPQGLDNEAAAAGYFGRWQVHLATGTTERNICFSAPFERLGRKVELKVLLGTLDKPIFQEHIVKVWSIHFYRLETDTTSAQWTQYQQLVTDSGLNLPGAWDVQANSTEVDVTFAADCIWDFKESTSDVYDASMSTRDGLVLRKGEHYRVRVRARSPDERLLQVGVWDSDGAANASNVKNTFGGTKVMKLTSTRTYYEHTFQAEADAVVPDTAAGRGKLTIAGGSAGYGAATGSILVMRLMVEKWSRAVPALPTVPTKPDIGRRTLKFTPTTAVPATGTPQVLQNATAAPATGTPLTAPKEMLARKTLSDLYSYLYGGSKYLLSFEGQTVESIDIPTFRAELGNIMFQVCLTMGFAGSTGNCQLKAVNVEVVEVCYTNLTKNNGEYLYFDPRSCRGLGKEPISYSHSSTRNVNATSVDAYMVFTFVGLPSALTKNDAFEREVIKLLNARIEMGSVTIRPTVDGATQIVPGPPITLPPAPQTTYHGLEDWQWALLLSICLLCAFCCGFVCWYNHRLVQIKREMATKELLNRNTEPDYVPTILSGMGMLTLNDLGLLKRQFDMMDADSGGTLDKKEIRDVLSKVVEFSEEEFVKFFTEIDEDGNEEIEFREFATGFVPYLVSGTVGVHAGEGMNLAEEADYLFGALQGTQESSSLFELKNVDEKESDRRLEQMSVMERVASESMVKLIQRQEQQEAVMPVTTLLDVDTEVLITDDKERLTWAMELMQEVYVSDPAENPEMVAPDLFSLAGQRGHVGEVWEEEKDESDEDEDALYDRDRDSEADFGFAYRIDFPHMEASFWIHRCALDHKPVDFIHGWITKQKRRQATARENRAIFWAVMAGLVSSLSVAVVEYVCEKEFSEENSTDSKFDMGVGGKEPAYWAILIPVTLVVTILEIIFLYYNVVRATVAICKIFGVVLYPIDEARSFLIAALSRTAFEIGNSVKPAWGIDPARELSDWQRVMADLAYKAKTGVGAFAGRLLFKRVITRVGAKAASTYVACPFIMFMNFLVARLVLNKTRDVGLGPRLITKMLENLERKLEPGATPWQLGSQWVTVAHFEKLSVNILRAIGVIVVARGEWHPCLEHLFRETRIRLGMVDTGGLATFEEEENKRLAREQAKRERKENGEQDGDDEEESDEEALFEEMRNMERIKLDIEPGVDTGVLEKLIIALRLDQESAFLRQMDANESGSDSDDEDERYDWAFSDYSSRSDPPPPICFDQNEKTLILKFLVLAIIVSGPMDSKIDKLVQRVFAAAGGDITTRPHRTIEALYNMFHDGNLREVCRSFELVFRAHRTMKGDDQRIWDRLTGLVDW